MKAPTVISLALSFALLSGCGGGGGGGTGEVTVRVADAPVDAASQVVVQFDGIELRGPGLGTQTFSFEQPRRIDLLALSEGRSQALLEGVTLPAGRYTQLRLLVSAGQNASDSFIELEDGSVHPLYIPSGNESGLKLVGGFAVPAGGRADFTIDFDLRKSITYPAGLGGAYLLKPALRVVETAGAGAIAGTVAASLATAEGCDPAVYVYSGAGVSADDVGSATPPLSSALVGLDESTGTYGYRAALLPAGDYTAAFTCGAGADDPASDDDIAFTGTSSASVLAGRTATVGFSAD